MEFVDTHCHIQSAGRFNGERQTSELWSKAPDLTAAQIVKNAKADGVKKLICVGCELADSRLAIDFAPTEPDCFASIGIHPHEAQHFAGNSEKLQEFAELANQPKVVAVGECGLDYFYEYSPKEAQAEILKFQIELALEHDLPMIFHVREAFDDFWPIFESYKGGKIRGALHSFTDNQENLARAVKHGLFVGVNGIATFAKQPEQLAMYKAIPPGNLLLETDAPFLTPIPFRGQINEPKHVRTVAEFLAKLRNEPLEELAKTTTVNAEHLFGI